MKFAYNTAKQHHHGHSEYTKRPGVQGQSASSQGQNKESAFNYRKQTLYEDEEVSEIDMAMLQSGVDH